REIVAQPPELPVFRAEIVAPLADAMGFVDRDESHPGLLQQTPQRRAALTRDAFRRYVQQPAAIFAHAGDDGVPFVRRLRAVQERGLHPVDAEAVDLIL